MSESEKRVIAYEINKLRSALNWAIAQAENPNNPWPDRQAAAAAIGEIERQIKFLVSRLNETP